MDQKSGKGNPCLLYQSVLKISKLFKKTTIKFTFLLMRKCYRFLLTSQET